VVFVGALAAVGLVNQFAYEGSAYAANVTAGVPGRVELHSRVAGYSLYVLPLLIAIAAVVGACRAARPRSRPWSARWWPPTARDWPWSSRSSVRGAYALPDTSNPFALSSGGGLAKGLASFGGLFASIVGTIPMQVAAYLLGDVWLWIGLPVGVAYGTGAYALGSRLAGDLLERRMPELLAAVTPNR
jgi:ABC-2 type transport system permease protein